jgi:hypothetical protein
MLTENPSIATIHHQALAPIIVFRNDYWPDGTVPTASQFRREVNRRARLISKRLKRTVAIRIVQKQFAKLFIL